MPGVSKKTPLPHWQKVMDKAGWHNAKDVSKGAHICYSAAYEIIHGVVSPSNETILKIAKAARISPDIIAADVYGYEINILATKRGIAS